jgi:chromate reductase
MPEYKVGYLIGSLAKGSINRKLAKALVQLAPKNLSFEEIGFGDLPLYSYDYDADYPEVARRFKAQIEGCDAVLFVTPEYNRSIPGVLKNAIDHASRPYGQSAWKGKPAGVVGVSVGATGTALAQQHLRNVLAYLDMPTLGQPEAFIQNKEGLFDDAGGIGEASRKFLQGWMDAFAAHVKRHLG